MKKRLISLLLTLVMLVSLCAGISVNASADAQVTTVTLSSGDTVLKLCQKLGVDYYAHKNLIMKLNGLSSEAQFSKLSVGTQVVLPVSNAAAASLAGSGVGVGTTTAPTVPAGSATGTGVVSGTTTSIPAGDYASYYLVAYTIQPGETIAGIYNNWGLSYKTYANQILKLNGLGSFNSIPAGKTLVLPTTNPAVAGTSYVTVMAHVMKTGDSAYNIICTDYGLNYNAVQKQLQALNNRENLANFMVGEVLYIPITGLVSSNTNVNTSTGSSSSNATINNSAAYNLVSQTPVNGSFSLLVDGAVASTAFAGKTVEVVASPNAGYALSSITVSKVGDASTTVAVSGNKFVMPSYSVSISVNFTQAIVSNITVDNASNGGVSALVNGMTVTQATAGNLVTVKTIPATGFMLDAVRVTYNNYRDTVAVENNQFVMPAFPVTVTASFKEDPNYDPSKGHNIYIDSVNGTVSASIGAETVSTAKKGDRVTLTVTPNANYTLQSLTVYYDNFKKTVDIEKNAFTMPDAPVTVVANITATADAQFGITKVHNADGKFTVSVDGTEVTSAKVGATVKIAGSSTKAYYNYIPTVFKTGDAAVTVPVAADGTFVMPDFPVTVTLKFYVYHNVILDASNGTKGWFNVTAVMNGMAVQKCGAGVELKVTVWGYNKNYYAPGNVILTYADGSTHVLDGATFIMPDCDVKVRVNFNEVQKLVAHAPDNNPAGKAGNSYTVLGKTINDNNSNATATVNAGKLNTVTVTPKCALGYQVDSMYYTYTAVGTAMVSTVYVNPNPINGKYQFQMPELEPKTNLDLYVKFKQIQNYSIDIIYNAENANLSMGSASALTSIGAVTNAVEGAKITMKFAAKEGYGVDLANLVVLDKNGNDISTLVTLNRNDYTFYMPAEAVTVYVPFKSVTHTVKLALAPTPAGDTQPKGIINAVVDGTKYTDDMLTAERKLPVSVKEGTVVTIINESRTGFILNSENPIVVTRVNTGMPIEVKTIDNDRFSFQMPDDDVVVMAQYQDDMYTIIGQPSAHGTYSVPKQAAYSATEPVVVTNISPERGYELDKILVSYIDHNNRTHQAEVLTNGTSFIPEGGGIPMSDVYFEVIFKPVLNPMTINYIFNGTHNTSANYAVDLTVDGKLVEGIERCSFSTLGATYQDQIHTYDVGTGEKTGYGIPTGATVIISRQQFNIDKNFDIINIWVEHNGNAITPQFSNGQYYFNVPYVDSQLAGGLVVNIQYAKANDDSFNLVANKVSGTGNNATVEFKVEGNPGTIAKPSDTINVTLTPDAVSEIGADALLKWVDKDSNPQQAAVTLAIDGSGVATADLSGLVSSLPKSASVTLEYVSMAKSFTITDASGVLEFVVDGAVYVSGDSIPWGSLVTARSGDATQTLTRISVQDALGNPVLTNDGFIFTMPQSDAVVSSDLVPASFTLSRIFDGNGVGSSTALIKVGDGFVEDGSAIACGTTVTIVPQPDANGGSACTAVAYLNGGVETAATDNGDGTWSFTMPAENSIVKVTFNKVTFDLVHAHATGSPASNYTLVVDGGATVSNPGTTQIGVGQNVTIIPDTGYQLSAATVRYTDKNDQTVAFNITSFLVNADGYKYFSVPSAPKTGTAVDLELNFALIKVNSKVLDDSGYDTDKVTAKFNGAISGSEHISGNTITVELKVRYDQVLDLSSVAVTYNDGMTDIPVALKDAVKYKSIADNGADATYTFSFVMPKYDTKVSYTLTALDKVTGDYNISCTDANCPTTASAGTLVSFIPSSPAVKATATYKVDGETKTINANVDSVTGEVSFTVPELPWHSNNQLNNVTVTLSK